MSADPITAAVSAVRINNNNQNADNELSATTGENKLTTFGIKLKKLEISNMSLSKEIDQDTTKHASLLEATPESII